MSTRACLCSFLFALLAVNLHSDAKTRIRALTTDEVSAVIQSVEDEIYADGEYSEFYQFGENISTPQHWKSRMHIYINPQYGGRFEANEGSGEVIYKFMPYGEIVRLFFLEKGQVLLVGDPHNRFPMTQPSHQTVFDDDEMICDLKRTWLKRSFIVDASPTAEMIEQASRRQRLRTAAANEP